MRVVAAAVADAFARRYQLVELPPLTPYVKEWLRHAVTCPDCGHSTRAAYDETQIPASPFGPRLMALMALLTGVYHLSRRRATELLSDVMGVGVSLGALSAVEARVSEAVRPAVDEAYRDVLDSPVKHTDGTSWFQSGVARPCGPSPPPRPRCSRSSLTAARRLSRRSPAL